MRKEVVKYYIERGYPYVIALIFTTVICSVAKSSNTNWIESENLNSLIEGIITLDSIIIGFIGAIMPVVLSMKNESKFVKYVFEKDEKGLFKKYLTTTIAYGLSSIALSLIFFLRDSIENKVVVERYAYVYMFSILLFFLLTYRSMSFMIRLIFSNESELRNNEPELMSQEEKQKLRAQKLDWK
jgi:hypothetical protein